jgi:uncharacterized protein (DUF4415 family)
MTPRPVTPDERREPVTMRLPAWLLDRYRSTGRGWQTRLANMLEAIERSAMTGEARKFLSQAKGKRK